MILRKPYKFLIKHFKLIHIVMTILMSFLFIKYLSIFSFINKTYKSYSGIISSDSSNSLFSVFIYLISLLVIIVSIFLIYLLRSKKKGVKLYISTVVAYIYFIVILSYTYNVIQQLSISLVDLSVLHNLKDLLFLSGALQLFEIGFFVVRALGIDLKNFNFNDDLVKLDVEDDDNAEFELNINIDTDKITRSINKQKRLFGYFYKENKGIFYFLGAVLVVVIGYFVYLFFGVYNKFYSQGKYFTTNTLSMAITNSYVTDYDYVNNEISKNKSFVILEISVKARSGLRKINASLPELVMGFDEYHYDNDYAKYFADLGTGYNNEDIDTTFHKYILVYPIKKSDRNRSMRFKYSDFSNISDLSAKNVNVSLKVRDLDKVKDTIEYNLGDEIDFSKSILGNTKFKLTEFEEGPDFTLNYNFCVTNDYCYNSIEILKPSIINNYEKILLKLKGNIEWDEEKFPKKSTNLFEFAKMYGSFSYVKDGKETKDITTLKQVESVRVNQKDTYYFEIISDAKDSEIYLVLKVRDYIYKYKIS